MKKKIEKYTSEFRKEVVRLALQTEQPKAVIADELVINRNTLYTWIQKAMQERVDLSKTKNQNITIKYQNLEEENRALRAKIKRIEQERDILKPQRILQPKICKIRFYRETWYLLPYQASL